MSWRVSLRYLIAVLIGLVLLAPGVASLTPSAAGASTASACAATMPGAPGIAGGSALEFGQTDLTGELNGLQALGSRWLRADVMWSFVQSQGPTSYDWSKSDPPIQGAMARGINVDAVITYSPSWAEPAGAYDDHYPPTDPTYYANFAAAAVQHYAPMGVHTWEIWNEPNIPNFWRPAANVAQYATLLKDAYGAIKSADPTATVLTGGTAPAATTANSLSPVDFLSGLYANGAGGHFDAVGHHPYSWPAMPASGDSWSAWSQMSTTNPSLRSVMSANGDANKQIWATEYGAPTNQVTEDQQAAMVAAAYQNFESYSWAGPLFIYSYKDLGTDTTNVGDWFGLMRYDGSLKPSWSSFQAAATAFNNGCNVPPPCTTYSSPSTGSHQVCGAIRDKYNTLGGPSGFLGYPVTDEMGTPDGVGRYNHFANAGSIYWTPSTGAWSIHGEIRAKWAVLGWERSFLGYPVTDETGAADGVGRYNDFANGGSIYWTPTTGPWSIRGGIRWKYLALGGPTSFLGYPVTDEMGTPDGVGRFNHFSNAGSIYWTPSTGALSIHGAIRAKWASLGWERSFLGYPVTDEMGTPDGGGRYNHFANAGSIYWTPSTGPWSIHGAIRAKWASMGWETSCLGYPVSDEFAIWGGRQSNLQRGIITFSWTTGVATSSC